MTAGGSVCLKSSLLSLLSNVFIWGLYFYFFFFLHFYIYSIYDTHLNIVIFLLLIWTKTTEKENYTGGLAGMPQTLCT